MGGGVGWKRHMGGVGWLKTSEYRHMGGLNLLKKTVIWYLNVP